LAIARDLMVTDILSVVLDDDLHTALRRFTTRNIDELPVVSPENPRELIGMLRRKDTIAFYNRRLTEQKNERKE
jgi:CIC family chloride channel protein